MESDFFDFLIMACIIINTAIMASEEVDMSEQREKTIEQANVVFVLIFSIEMVLKLVGLGVRDYVTQRANIFDAILVILSLSEFVLSYYDLAFLNVVILRGFRVFRVLKLAKSWKSL